LLGLNRSTTESAALLVIGTFILADNFRWSASSQLKSNSK